MTIGLLPGQSTLSNTKKDTAIDGADTDNITSDTASDTTSDSTALSPESFTDINQLSQIISEFWREGVLGIDIFQILIGALILFAFLVFRGLFTKYVLNRLHDYAKLSSTILDDKVISALSPPIQFIPVVLGVYFSFRYVGLHDALGDLFPQIIKTMIAYIVFWSLFRSLLPISHGLSKLERILTPTMVSWLFKSLRVATVLIGGAVILEIWGIKVGPLLAGFGLFGVAVALGAQDFFKNLIAGITVIAEKRFQPGDWIKVDGVVEGIVEDVGIRSTQVRRFDKAPVHVPNSQLSDTAITNFSRMTNRRIFWTIGVEYKTTTEQLKIIRDDIIGYITNNDKFEKDGVPLLVRVDSFGASSIDIMLYCFTKTTIWADWLEIKEELAFEIKDIVENRAGTGFAFPSQSVYIETMPDMMGATPNAAVNNNGDQAEAFIPPSTK